MSQEQIDARKALCELLSPLFRPHPGFEVSTNSASLRVEDNRVSWPIQSPSTAADVRVCITIDSEEPALASTGPFGLYYKADCDSHVPPQLPDYIKGLARRLSRRDSPRFRARIRHLLRRHRRTAKTASFATPTPPTPPEEVIYYGNTLELRPTIRCNQNCRFCNTGPDADNVMDGKEPTIAAIGEASRKPEITRLVVSGGEPTLLSFLPELIREASRSDFGEVNLQTNGVLLDTCERAAPVYDAGLSSVFFSLHSADAETSDSITGMPGGFERTCRAVDIALERENLRVSLNMVLHSDNYRQVKDVVSLACTRWRAEVELVLSYVFPSHRAQDDPTLFPRIPQLQPHLLKGLQLAKERGLKVALAGRCGVPLCAVPGFESCHKDMMEEPTRRPTPDSLNVSSDPERQALVGDKTHADFCVRCRYYDRCPGLPEQLVEMGWFDDLSPVE